MGCGASQKVVPYHGVPPPTPSKKRPPVSKVAPVQDFTSLATLMDNSAEFSGNMPNSMTSPKPTPPSRKDEPSKVVVSAEDLVDLEQSALMMPKKSWDATRHGPPGMPLPPDRQCHEEYLQQLNGFRRFVKRNASTLSKEIQSRRDRDEDRAQP